MTVDPKTLADNAERRKESFTGKLAELQTSFVNQEVYIQYLESEIDNLKDELATFRDTKDTLEQSG